MGQIGQRLFKAWLLNDHEGLTHAWRSLWEAYHLPLERYFTLLLENEAGAETAAEIVLEQVVKELNGDLTRGRLVFRTLPEFASYVKEKVLWRPWDYLRRHATGGPHLSLHSRTSSSPNAPTILDVTPNGLPTPHDILLGGEGADHEIGAMRIDVTRPTVRGAVPADDPLSDHERLRALRVSCARSKALRSLVESLRKYAAAHSPEARTHLGRSRFVMKDLHLDPESKRDRNVLDLRMRQLRRKLPETLRALALSYRPQAVGRRSPIVWPSPVPATSAGPRLVRRQAPPSFLAAS